MANKNTKQLRRAVKDSCRRGEIVCDYATKSAHGGSTLASHRVPTALRGAGGVVSANPRRNMQMTVLHNTNDRGIKSTLTVHEPIDRKRYITHKNHGYEHFPQYRQAMQTSSRPATV